ncbi:hypothetical protein PAXRUDRAFT_510400 [Paxillus rubicundulus Ve08.2h10]|uniref:Uncharacterized protein n=1 Tax=Paxillus rubicundulus Ve08.2h10 TaxID=930991 RepID=A0A0D0DNQ7_9AGAM|nr:hypothetical protein PAXRUDRAFT_510400 [Paxillus rubicundulus Ve08.2h10]
MFIFPLSPRVLFTYPSYRTLSSTGCRVGPWLELHVIFMVTNGNGKAAENLPQGNVGYT